MNRWRGARTERRASGPPPGRASTRCRSPPESARHGPNRWISSEGAEKLQGNCSRKWQKLLSNFCVKGPKVAGQPRSCWDMGQPVAGGRSSRRATVGPASGPPSGRPCRCTMTDTPGCPRAVRGFCIFPAFFAIFLHFPTGLK